MCHLIREIGLSTMRLLYYSGPVARRYVRWHGDTFRQALRTLLGPQVLGWRFLKRIVDTESISSESGDISGAHAMFSEEFIEHALSRTGYNLKRIDITFWSKQQFVAFLLASGRARFLVKIVSPTERLYSRYWARALEREGEAALRRQAETNCVWIGIACDVGRIYGGLVDDTDAPGSSGVEPLNSANLWRLVTFGVVEFALLYRP